LEGEVHKKCNSSVTEGLVPECIYATFSIQCIHNEGNMLYEVTYTHTVPFDGFRHRAAEETSADVTDQETAPTSAQRIYLSKLEGHEA